jgi:flagellar basal-body rod protein FlgG
MIRALSTAATGMEAQQTRLDVTANNIANTSTAGFKRSRAEFSDLMYQSQRAPGAATGNGTQAPTGLQVGMGVRTVSTQRMHSQGELRQTGRPLDVAIEGRGFYPVTLPGGEVAYTRDGALKIDAEGTLVTAEAGQLQLAAFANESGLEAMGRNLYRETSASGTAVVGAPGENGSGTLAQGTLELSNVNVVEEMIDLISGQRAYEINSRVIKAADEMLAQTATLK